jgi:serine/threonine protein kinase
MACELTPTFSSKSPTSTPKMSSTASTTVCTTTSSISKNACNVGGALSPSTGLKPPNERSTKQSQDWWQKSVVRRSVPSIQAEVNQIMATSVYLRQQSRPSDLYHPQTIPLFHRHEIRTGRMIGTGGFSDVHQVTCFELDPSISERCTPEQQVLRMELAEAVRNESMRLVVKHLKKSLVATSIKNFSRAASDLVMEATYMSALSHPNILPVRGMPIDGVRAFDMGDHDGYFILMDQLNGTLGDQIRKWKVHVDTAPSLEEKACYALQIASALHYLHDACGMVFRDLKPQNMGFDANTGTLQLFDFGLCRELPEVSNKEVNTVYAMSGVGTRRYMAPEIINDGKYNEKVDVYSWAMVVAELLTGVKPYASYGTEEHRIAVCQGGERPRLHFYWPHWLQTVLQRTWCESIADRWSMFQVAKYMTQFLQMNNCRRTIQPQIQLFAEPDSPADVRNVDGILMPSVLNEWILMPELPDIHSPHSNDRNCVIPWENRLPQCRQRRNTLHLCFESPLGLRALGIESSSMIWDKDTNDNENMRPTALTMCLHDGCVEVCPNIDVNITSSPKLISNTFRSLSASCVMY